MSILRRLLSELRRERKPARPAPGAPPDPREVYPEIDAHARAPMALHTEILFRDARVGEQRFEDIMAQAVEATGLQVPPLKAIRRREATLNLIRYFRHARALPGLWAECGVFAGTTSLALCLAARAEQPGFDGAGLHLIDSFEGLSELGEADLRAAQAADGSVTMMRPPRNRTNFAAPLEAVRGAMVGFPGALLHKGWIPEVLAELPEAPWSFVHVDVDLYQPTLECLRYFFPRLVRGGIIVCDDYGSPAFPGARRAWIEFCGDTLGYVALPTGQSVLVKP